MQYGIYYAYWETEWAADYIPYVDRVKALGFDILEVAVGDFDRMDSDYFPRLGEAAKAAGITLTGGYGPRPEHNIASSDGKDVDAAMRFYETIFPRMQSAGIGSLCGGLYSYWPVDFSGDIDKQRDFLRSVKNMKRMADLAAEYGIELYMESLNRFEGYLLNDAREAVEYARAVDKPNVKVLLDTFHMNIEEDSLTDAIKHTGDLLGELHVGQPNRRPPCEGRFDWEEIGEALKSIGFDGPVVMEPFVLTGGKVGADIKMWRDLSGEGTQEALDGAARESVAYLRSVFA